MKQHLFGDAHQLAAAVADELAQAISIARDRRAPFHLMLAGGSTPRAVYQLLPTDLLLDHVVLWFSDERMVAPDHAESNFAMVQRTWLSRATRPLRVVRIEGELGSEQAAVRCSAIADEYAPLVFDVVLLGVGSDGHTASLFPGDDWATSPAHFVVAKQNTRVSASFQHLASAHQVMFLLSGESKAEIAKLMVAQAPQSVALPCTQLIAARASKSLPTSIWLDGAAARGLS